MTEATYLFPLTRPNVLYYQMIQIKAKEDQCFSIVVLRCSSTGPINAGLYIDFSNTDMSYWEAAFSLEEQGMLRLFVLSMLAAVALSVIYWRFTTEMELLGVHGQLIVLTKTSYGSLTISMVLWVSFYGLYAITGLPSVLFKALACYAQWVFELSTISILALNSTGYFLRDFGVLFEVQIVLFLNGCLTFYLCMLKALENEDVLEFHWFCASSWTMYLRGVTVFVLFLWSGNAWKRVASELRDRQLYISLLISGLVWGSLQPLGIIGTKIFLARFRWKYAQALVGTTADLAFLAWLLSLLNPSKSALLFSKETALQSLKSHKSRSVV